MKSYNEIVVNLDLSIRLNQLHIIDDSLLFWEFNPRKMSYNRVVHRTQFESQDYTLNHVPAWTSEELTRKIPFNMSTSREGGEPVKFSVQCHVILPGINELIIHYASSETDAKGLILEHLIQKKYI